jgi:hypothetical protein
MSDRDGSEFRDPEAPLFCLRLRLVDLVGRHAILKLPAFVSCGRGGQLPTRSWSRRTPHEAARRAVMGIEARSSLTGTARGRGGPAGFDPNPRRTLSPSDCVF